jgi:hypothetical protein
MNTNTPTIASIKTPAASSFLRLSFARSAALLLLACALFLGVSPEARAAELASWPSAYSETQGENNWYYLFTKNEGEFNPDSSKNQMKLYTDRESLGGSHPELNNMWSKWFNLYTYINSKGLCMPCNDGSWTCLRWVSNHTGKAEIEVTFQRMQKKPQQDNSGVIGILRVNGDEKWSTGVIGDGDAEPHSKTISVELNEGDSVDFLVNPNGNNFHDETKVTVLINSAS